MDVRWNQVDCTARPTPSGPGVGVCGSVTAHSTRVVPAHWDLPTEHRARSRRFRRGPRRLSAEPASSTVAPERGLRRRRQSRSLRRPLNPRQDRRRARRASPSRSSTDASPLQVPQRLARARPDRVRIVRDAGAVRATRAPAGLEPGPVGCRRTSAGAACPSPARCLSACGGSRRALGLVSWLRRLRARRRARSVRPRFIDRRPRRAAFGADRAPANAHRRPVTRTDRRA